MKTINDKQNRFFKMVLILLSIIITGCSSEDASEKSKSKSELIVGSWKPIKDVDVCSTGSEDVYTYSTCEQKLRLIINANGNFSQTGFYEDFNNNCIADDDDTFNGTWQIDNGNLRITIEGQAIDITFFEISENILKLGMYEINPDYTCDGDNLPSHYYTEFIKI